MISVVCCTRLKSLWYNFVNETSERAFPTCTASRSPFSVNGKSHCPCNTPSRLAVVSPCRTRKISALMVPVLVAKARVTLQIEKKAVVLLHRRMILRQKDDDDDDRKTLCWYPHIRKLFADPSQSRDERGTTV